MKYYIKETMTTVNPESLRTTRSEDRLHEYKNFHDGFEAFSAFREADLFLDSEENEVTPVRDNAFRHCKELGGNLVTMMSYTVWTYNSEHRIIGSTDVMYVTEHDE